MADTVRQDHADMAEIEGRLTEGNDLTEIANQLEEIKQRGGGAAGLFAEVQSLVQALPDSVERGDEYAELEKQVAELASLVRGGEGPTVPGERQILELIKDKVDDEVSAGHVSQDRADTLQDLLADFGATMGGRGDDIQSLMNRVQEMRAKTEAQFANMHYLSHGIARPPEGSRAAELVELFWQVRLFLLDEMNRPSKTTGESERVFDLNVRAAGTDKRIYEAGSDDARAAVIDKEAVRPFALEVRSFAARHHPLLARPIWPHAKASVDPNAVFFSGAASVRGQVAAVCRELGLQLLTARDGDATGAARWHQLQTANTSVFDLSVQEGPELASVTYELGMARAVGKPVVVLARPDRAIPFDVDVSPVLLRGRSLDTELISNAIDRSLVWTMPRPRKRAVAETIADVLKRYPIPHSDIYVDQSLKQLERLQAEPDPVAVDAALATLVNSLSDGRPTVIHPVWPPVYPGPAKPRLFHVMPYRPGWADAAAASAERACAEMGVEYVRGDRVPEPNVIRSIWEEINRASYILADLTGFTPNVALELGMAHVLGRPTLAVGQGDTVERLFPAISRIRVYPYGAASSELFALVTDWLSRNGLRSK